MINTIYDDRDIPILLNTIRKLCLIDYNDISKPLFHY